MPNILQICNKAPYPPDDGSSIAVYKMACGLLENQCQLAVLAINTKKHYKPDTAVPEDFLTATSYTSVYANTNTSLIGALFNLFSNSSYFVSRFYLGDFEQVLIRTLKG